MLEQLDSMVVICDPKKPEVLAYANVYESGDLWLKIRDCTDCPPEKNCCKNCPLSTEKGCYLHLINKGQDKPYHCVVEPSPMKHRPDCCLEYRCINGKYKGLIRKQCEPRNILINEKAGEKITV